MSTRNSIKCLHFIQIRNDLNWNIYLRKLEFNYLQKITTQAKFYFKKWIFICSVYYLLSLSSGNTSSLLQYERTKHCVLFTNDKLNLTHKKIWIWKCQIQKIIKPIPIWLVTLEGFFFCITKCYQSNCKISQHIAFQKNV